MRVALLILLGWVSAQAAKTGQDPNCVSKDSVKALKGILVQQVTKVNDLGKAIKAECGPMEEPQRTRCLEQLKPLRLKVAAMNQEIASLNEGIQRFMGSCPEPGFCGGDVRTRELYQIVAKEHCHTPKGDPKRCEDALFNRAEIDYARDNRANFGARESYGRAHQAWEDGGKQGKEPTRPIASFAKGLEAHLRYLKEWPEGGRRDIILYRTAFLYDTLGRPSDAFPLLMELSRKYPQSRQIGPANLRIGEFYFQDLQYDSAIAYYQKVDLHTPGTEAVLGVALFHHAESNSRLGRYLEAAALYVTFIDAVDRGQIRSDKRADALRNLGWCFLRDADPLGQANRFFATHGVPSYRDTVLEVLGTGEALGE